MPGPAVRRPRRWVVISTKSGAEGLTDASWTSEELVDPGHELLPQRRSPLYIEPTPSELAYYLVTAMSGIDDQGRPLASQSISEYIRCDYEVQSQSTLKLLTPNAAVTTFRTVLDRTLGQRTVTRFDAAYLSSVRRYYDYPILSGKTRSARFLRWALLFLVTAFLSVAFFYPNTRYQDSILLSEELSKQLDIHQNTTLRGYDVAEFLDEVKVISQSIESSKNLKQLPPFREAFDRLIPNMELTSRKLFVLDYDYMDLGFRFHKSQGDLTLQLTNRPSRLSRWLRIRSTPDADIRQHWLDTTKSADERAKSLYWDLTQIHLHTYDIMADLHKICHSLKLAKKLLQKRKNGGLGSAAYKLGLVSNPVPDLEGDLKLVEHAANTLQEIHEYVGSLQERVEDQYRNLVNIGVLLRVLKHELELRSQVPWKIHSTTYFILSSRTPDPDDLQSH